MTDGPKRRELAVVILIDALGWEIVQHFGFCRDILPRSAPLETVLGYSSAAIPSLLSGTVPAEHGHWAMYRYAPRSSPFRYLRHVPSLPHALEWRLRRLVRRVTDRRGLIQGYYDLYEIPPKLLAYFDVSSRGDPYTPGGLARETLFDRLEKDGVPYKQWNYRTAESDNFSALRAAIDCDARMLFLYTAELDALMHRVGIFDDAVGEKLAWYEARILEIRDAAAGRDLTLYVFSDHGMTDVTRVADLMSQVERWGIRLGRDVVAFYDSTMARFWCKTKIGDKLTEKLNSTGWGRVMTDAELERFGCRFEDGSYGEVIFLMAPGGLIVPSFMGKEAIAAMHGYDPADRYSKGCFLCSETMSELPGSILDLKDFLLKRIVRKANG